MNIQIQKFHRTLQEYLRYNQRELGPLIENRAKRIQWNLYRRFRGIAPTPQKIEQEFKSRGYRIRRRKGKNGKALSAKAELGIRKRSVKWLSVSFLLRSWKVKRRGQSAAFHAFSRRKWKVGQAVVRTALGQRNPSVRIESFLKGAAIQNDQRNIINQTLQKEISDMETYVARKQQEAFKNRFSKSLTRIIHI